MSKIMRNLFLTTPCFEQRCFQACAILSSVFLLSCTSFSTQQQTPLPSGFALSLKAILLGDPDGQADTYFSDNSVATEAVEFSPDGTFFASVSKSKNSQASLKLWRSEDTSLVWEVSLPGETECVSFDKEARMIIVGGEDESGQGRLSAFSVNDATQLWTAPAPLYPKSIEGMRFSPDFTKLATGDENGAVVIWDTRAASPESWRIIGKLDVKNTPEALADVNQIDWTSDSRYFVTAERDGDVDMYDVYSLSKTLRPKPLKRFLGFAGASVKSVRISPDNQYIAAGAGLTQGVRVWRMNDASLLRHLPSEPSPQSQTQKILNAERYESVAFTPDSRTLIVGGTWPSWWFTANEQANIGHKVPLHVFDVDTLASENQSIPFQSYEAWRTEYLDFNRAGDLLVSGHDDGTIRLWQVQRKLKTVQ